MIKLLKNRKGSGDLSAYDTTQKVFFYIALVVLIGLSMTALIIILNNSISSKANVHESIDADFALARITNVCFAYSDSTTEELKQNILDENKITSLNLAKCFESKGISKTFEIVIKPIVVGDFEKISVQLGNRLYSKQGYGRYTLIHLNSGEIKPAMIYYLP